MKQFTSSFSFTFFSFVILFLLFTATKSYSQLFEENFNYSNGALTTIASGTWSESPSGSFDIQIVDGNLEYTSYSLSNIGRKIQLDGGATGREGIETTFSVVGPSNGSSIYASFLLNVTSIADMDISTSDGEYFAVFGVDGSNSIRSGVFVRQGSAAKFQIGLGKTNSSTPVWYSTELDINTTYLIVVNYTFQSGSDAAKLWINPDLSSGEPAADLTTTTGSDASDGISKFYFKQRALSGDMDIDGLMIGNAWSNAPLPVELTSFSANAGNNSVQLRWTTATEINNYGFEIERATNQNGKWENIGFVRGHGNSNSTLEYTYTDNNPLKGKIQYRLKQIDFDGAYKFFDPVAVVINNLNFSLKQNFPNPFNPVTKISYSLPVDGMVTLKVYDILSREVATLVSEYKQAGKYVVEFNGSELSSGTYFYTLSVGKFIQTKKLLLIK